MTEPIKPALTPEEWSELLDRMRDADEEDSLRRSREEVAEDYVAYCAEAGPGLHAAAAAALYGQPFGFTWEDVDQLMTMTPEGGMQIAPRWTKPLALRIAALLAPREIARWEFEHTPPKEA